MPTSGTGSAHRPAAHEEPACPGGVSLWQLRNQMADSLILGWETYDARPRFGTNWTGLRGQMAILSEAYSNDPFPARITSTEHSCRRSSRWRPRSGAASSGWWRSRRSLRPDSVAVGSILAPPTEQPVIAEITTPDGDGDGPFARASAREEFRTIRMPVWDRFNASCREARPVAYIVPPSLPDVASSSFARESRWSGSRRPGRGRPSASG